MPSVKGLQKENSLAPYRENFTSITSDAKFSRTGEVDVIDFVAGANQVLTFVV
jgi:hypothetical protein